MIFNDLNLDYDIEWQVRPNFFSVANQAIINMGLS